MNLFKLELEIKDAYNNKNYKEALEKINLYLSRKDSGVYGSFMFFFIDCLIKVGRKKEAYQYINITRKIWPYVFSDDEIVKLYIICDRVKEAEKILNSRTNDTKLYYTAAKTYMLNGYYYSSKYWFRYLMSITDDEDLISKSNKFVFEINNHLINKSFIRTSYARYKSYGNRLHAGQIIYYNNENTLSDDNKANHRPYLIWKVDNDKIYCFPVTTKIKRTDINYVLKKEKYPNIGFDRMIKDKLVCIDEKTVEKIIDEITPYDYDRVIDSIYKSYCHKGIMDKYGFVLEEANKLNIKKDDIISIYDIVSQTRYLYVIDSVKDGIYTSYKVEKINDELKVIYDDIYTFTNKDFIVKINMSINNKEDYQLIYKRKIGE